MQAEAWAILITFAVVVAAITAKQWWPFNRVAYIVSRHVGAKASTLSTLGRPFAIVDLPNIERALREMAPQGRRLGLAGGMFSFRSEELGTILTGNFRAAGVRTESIRVGAHEQMACMVNGLILIDVPGKAAVYVRREDMLDKLEVHVAAKDPLMAETILGRIEEGCGKNSVYRGRIISLSSDKLAQRGAACLTLRFHEPVDTIVTDVILPRERLDLIERNTAGFFRNLDQLKATGRSVKRGILLYGRPGTGKTMTAKWIASTVPGLTTLFLSADQLFLIKDCCQMARLLAPAMVVLEDVDLIARDRGQDENIHSRISLHQLLNEMDGIADNTGVLFLLTTNRPEELEHALAARPGRVDQAIEYPLPDRECRERLFEKYLEGLPTENLDLTDLVARTDGAPPAFIQEFVRKAVTLSLFESSGTVRQEHFRAALDERLFAGGDLTRKLLGFSEGVVEGHA